MREGRIASSSSLGYEVYLEDGSTIRAKRRKGRDVKEGLPMIGDLVVIDDQDQIQCFKPRTRTLERPRVANLDQVAVIVSAKQPALSTFLLDKYLSACSGKSVPAFIVVTKWDLLKDSEIEECENKLSWYRKLGYSIFRIGIGMEDDLSALKSKVEGRITAFMGQTGVGKSSLANAVDSSFNRPIGRFDASMGRGTHQTKEVVLIPFAGGFLADTPGFSDFRLTMTKEELAENFPGYSEFSSSCRFKGCLHNRILGCGVESAVRRGELSPESFDNYQRLLADSMEENPKERKSSHSSRIRKA